MGGNTRLSTKTLMEIKKKKHVLLEDEALDWFQIRMVASSLDVKGNKAIKKKFACLGCFSQIQSHFKQIISIWKI